MNENSEHTSEEMNSNSPAQEAEILKAVEYFSKKLENVIPEDVMDIAKNVQPAELSLYMLMGLGGRILQTYPELDLSKYYDIPEEVLALNDTIDDFEFEVAPSPFYALARAMTGEINADEEIIQSCELKGFVPLVIRQDDTTKRIALINYDNHQLEITAELGQNISIDMTGDTTEQAKAMEQGMQELDEFVCKMKDKLAQDPKNLQLFESPEEEAAITTWCEKHSYQMSFIFRASMDRYF